MKPLLYVLLICAGCACSSRQPVSVRELIEKSNMPPERATCLLSTEAAYQLRKKACGENRASTCSTDWLVDKQHEEIDECFSNF